MMKSVASKSNKPLRTKRSITLKRSQRFNRLSPLLGFLAVGLSSCIPVESVPVSEVVWADGDSGRVDGARFRLADVDAPELGSSAKCAHERELGRAAKSFVEAITSSGNVQMVDWGDVDRYDRKVVDLMVDGQSVIDLAIAEGHLEPWTHIDGRSVGPKPYWC